MKIYKLKMISVFLVLSLFTVTCREKPLTASVTMIRGNVTVTPENTTLIQPTKLGATLKQGDTIQTGENSGVILNIRETGSYIEIQSNSIFHLTALKENKIELFSEKGNVWVNTEKKIHSTASKETYFRLVTPTMVAAVRGTTFYVFNIEGMEGVCHCKGDVEFSRSRSTYRSEHHTDNLVISKDDKSALLTQEDLRKIGLQHNHSMFEKGPIGPQNQLKPNEYKTFVVFLKKKLAAAK